jgi:hypothetical protein
MSIKGLDGMTQDQLADELQRGGRFVIFNFAVSVLVLSFKQPTSIYFIRGNESALVRALPFIGISLVFGWWGIPWGPIYTIWSLVENLGGGKDVTREVVGALLQAQPQQPQVIDAVLAD